MTATTRSRATPTASRASLRFSRINLILAGAALAALALGYFTLSHGSTVAAPLLLTLGYVVLLPLAIIL